MYSLAKLRKLAAQGAKLEVCVTTSQSLQQMPAIPRIGIRELTDWVPFDAAAARGGSGMFRRGRDVSFDGDGQDALPGQRLPAKPGAGRILAEILIDGISYGNSKGIRSGNARQVEMILAQAGGADALAARFNPVVFATGPVDVESTHEARVAFRGLLDYAAARREAALSADGIYNRDLDPGVATALWLLPESFTALLQTEWTDVSPDAVEALLLDAESSYELTTTSPLKDKVLAKMRATAKAASRIGPMEYGTQEKLAEFALKSTVDDALSAVGMLTDRDLVYRVATSPVAESVALAALGALTDRPGIRSFKDLVYWIAVGDDVAEPVALAAVGMLTEQQLVYRVATSPVAEPVALAALGALTDRDLVYRVAANDDVAEPVALAAVGMLTDRDKLVNLAGNNSININTELVDVAPPKLTRSGWTTDNESVALASLAKLTRSGWTTVADSVALAALAKLTSQDEILQVARVASSEPVALVALAKLTSQDDFLQVAQRARNESVALAALGMLTDQELVYRAAVNADHESVSIAAVGMLTDQDALAAVVMASGTSEYRASMALEARLVAVKRLSDQVYLTRIALDGDVKWPGAGGGEIRAVAIQRLTSQETLTKIALSDKRQAIRLIAIRRLTNQETLANLALQDEASDVCLAAAETLTDQTLLQEVASETADAAVLKTALAKIVSQADRDEVLRTRGRL
jgi:hypothetical protein